MANFFGGLLGSLLGAAAGLLAFFMMPAKDRAEIDLKYLDVSLNILANEKPCDTGIRTWAVRIFNKHSPSEAQLPSEVIKTLVGGGCGKDAAPPALLPMPVTAASVQTSQGNTADKTIAISALETEGVNLLLGRDITGARDRFMAAYNLWPVYRTTDEIQRMLKDAAGKPPTTDEEWKALYLRVASCDLKGVNEDVMSRLAKAVDAADVRALVAKAASRQCK